MVRKEDHRVLPIGFEVWSVRTKQMRFIPFRTAFKLSSSRSRYADEVMPSDLVKHTVKRTSTLGF